MADCGKCKHCTYVHEYEVYMCDAIRVYGGRFLCIDKDKAVGIKCDFYKEKGEDV